MENTIRIGFIGAGSNTRARHIPNFLKLENVELAAVCNLHRSSSESVAQQFQIPAIYENWAELIADPSLDAVVIGTWPYLHCPAATAALDAGKHVLCEARMAMNAAESRQMLAAAKAHPTLAAQVVPAPFTLAVDPFVIHMIEERQLGEILAVSVRDGNSFLDMSTDLQWRQDEELSGMNVLTLGIWYECLMRWLGEARTVFAAGKVVINEKHDKEGREREVKIPEHLDVIAGMDCGALADFRLSNITGFGGDPGITLFGSEATLSFSSPNTLRFGRRGDRELQLLQVPDEFKSGWRVEEEFINAVRGHEPVKHTTFEDGVRYMNFTEAVHKSMHTGCRVEVGSL